MAKYNILKAGDFTALKTVLIKGKQLFIQRSGDNMFLADGHIIVKMPVTLYDQYMDRNYFPVIREDKAISSHFSKKTAEWSEAEFKLDKMYDESFIDDTSRATYTKLSYDASEATKARFVLTNKDLCAIDEKYASIASRFCGRNFIYGSTRKSPVFFINDNPWCYNIGFFILPINLRDYNKPLREFLAA